MKRTVKMARLLQSKSSPGTSGDYLWPEDADIITLIFMVAVTPVAAGRFMSGFCHSSRFTMCRTVHSCYGLCIRDIYLLLYQKFVPAMDQIWAWRISFT